MERRPFHPEGVVLLSEIAAASGRAATAETCRAFLERMAPGRSASVGAACPLPASGPFATSTAPACGSLNLPEAVLAALGGREPRLTVCLIVRNEERFLGACLGSIRGLAWQIVVVDTGSTDRTAEIARAHGAEVLEFAWIDDFSAARNAGLELARGDWILILDADEELPGDQHAVLRGMLRVDGVLSWRLPIVDAGREADGCSYVPRLFRNAPGAHFVGRVHEQAFGSLEAARRAWGMESRLGEATLVHHGYTAELTRSRDKVARNLALLERAIREQPGHPVLLMNLGLELARSGRIDESLRRYRAAFEAMSRVPASGIAPEVREALLDQYATRLLAARRPAEVVEVLTSPLAIDGGLTASLHFTLGLAERELKRFDSAAARFRACLGTRHQPGLTPGSAVIRGVGPRHLLARSLWEAGDVAGAEPEFRRARAEEPGSVPAGLDFARFLHATGRSVEALQELHGIVTTAPESAAAWLLGGRIATSDPGYLEVALDWTGAARELHPDHPELLGQRAEVLLLAGRLEEALAVWRRMGDGATARAARVLCEGGLGPVREVVPAGMETEVSGEYLRWYRRLLEFGQADLARRLGGAVTELEGRLPTAAGVLRRLSNEVSGSG